MVNFESSDVLYVQVDNIHLIILRADIPLSRRDCLPPSHLGARFRYIFGGKDDTFVPAAAPARISNFADEAPLMLDASLSRVRVDDLCKASRKL